MNSFLKTALILAVWGLSTAAGPIIWGPSKSAKMVNDGPLMTKAGEKISFGVHTVTSADYTILDGDTYGTILVSTGASNRTITLPTAADNKGRKLSIKKTDSGTGQVIIDGEGAETIDGSSALRLYTQYGQTTVLCNGTTWFVVEGPIENGFYTPTGTPVTNVTSVTVGTHFFYRVGNMVTVSGNTSVDPTAAGGSLTRWSLTIPIPSNFTEDGELNGVGGYKANGDESTLSAYAEPTADVALFDYTTISETAASDAHYTFTYAITP